MGTSGADCRSARDCEKTLGVAADERTESIHLRAIPSYIAPTNPA